MFPPRVERWRELAGSQGFGVPVDLILATIQRESNGTPGKEGYANVKHGYRAEEARGIPPAFWRRAAGLMQVAPKTWRWYTESTGDPVPAAYLFGTTTAEAARQVRIGSWALRQSLIYVRRFDPSFRWPDQPLGIDQALLGRLAYARGFSGLRAQLDRAAAAGYPRTFAGLESFSPGWGAPDRPFAGARSVIAAWQAGGAPAAASSPRPAPWPSSPAGAPYKAPAAAPAASSGAGLLFVAGAIALAFGLSRGGKRAAV